MEFFRKHLRFVSFITGMTVLLQMLLPTPAFPVTGHDSMPEYTGFTPYSTTDMVNLSDGSFTYNLPVMEVPGGYPINLSYNSGSVNPEAMASWVGLGWNLSPGSISLTKRGFPDTNKDTPVTYYSKMPRNWTLTAALGGGFESFGGENGLNVSAEGRVSFNNYKGITTGVSAGLSGLAGFVSLNFDYSGGRYGFNPKIDPGALAAQFNEETSGNDKKKKPTAKDNVAEKVKEQASNQTVSKDKKAVVINNKELQKWQGSRGSSKPQVGFNVGGVGFSSGSGYSFSKSQPSSFPTTLTSYAGAAFALKVELGINGLPIPLDPEAKVSGSFVYQDYEPLSVRQTYGYLHTEKALDHPEAMMDYYSENEKMFEKRDKYLAVPFPNNDIYVVSGEGIAGTFRAHRNDVGHYRKNYVESYNFSVNGGADINIASIATLPPFLANFVYTIGGNLGGDYTHLSIGNWDDQLQGEANHYKFRPQGDFPNGDEQFYFRFSHDKAENKGLNLDNGAKSATLEQHGLVAHPKLSPLPNKVDDREATGRSSNIGYSYSRDFLKESNTYKFLPEEKNLHILNESGHAISYDYTHYNTLDHGNSIAEFRITNGDGMRYVYGLPCYVKDEKNLNYSVKVRGDDQNVTIHDKKIAEITRTGIHDNAETVSGYTSAEAYAGTHLLTGITSPDYVDRENDGLTTDDFGTYTRFNYQRVAGGSAPWYIFRTPYKDANFEFGSLSSNNDDMASYSAGAKEVYNLHSISSKTHVAIFRTSNRRDGGSSRLSEASTMDAFLAGTDPNANVLPVKKLNRIDLYAIKDCDVLPNSDGIYIPRANALPIKSVCFEYNYSLCPGIPNNMPGNDVDGFANQGGKLTLKKVWFEYGGTLTEKISPYQFSYEYPTMSYPAPYAAFQNYGGQFGPQAQNPSYSVLDMDRWGNYRSYGSVAGHLGDLAAFYPYVDQQASAAQFDPAAWQLKRIQLPGGGEVHIQYEQGDYAYVQERPAMVMVPLSAATEDDDKPSNKYYLDLAKIGITATPDQALADALFRPMRVNKERLYFNYLYSLIGDAIPNPGDGKSESVEGFARIAGYGFDGGGIYFTFKDSNLPPPFTPIKYDNKFSKREVPKKVCKDFYNNNRRGLLTGNATALSQGTDESKIRALITMLNSIFNVTPCKKMSPTMSYVRLEAPKAKKGGPLRVKRLLMFDAGIHPADNAPVLFGQEYHYLKEEGGKLISSGVAANEPGTGRMENALVQPIDKSEQSKGEAILYGRDMYGQTGPIGEYAMAGPGVTYSNVVISNIHQGKTSTGFEVHEFFTSSDYPFKFLDTGIDQMMMDPVGLSLGGGGFGASYNREAPFLAQGYVFLQNEMDGQRKRVRKYGAGGVSLPPIAEEVYEYYQPGEALKLMNEKLEIEQGFPGRETEILSEMLQVKDITNGGNVEADISAGAALVAPLLPIVVVIPTLKKLGIYRTEKILRHHVTTKIVSVPAILKRTINRADGVTQESDFEVFDKATGAPLVTKTYDDFKGAYMSQEFRANWNYSNLGKKSRNEGLVTEGPIIYGVDQGREYIEFNGSGTCGEAGKFTEGDLIQLGPNNCGTNVSELLYHVDQVDLSQDRLYLFPSGMKAANCTPPANLNSVHILRSGFKNQLNTNMGGLMTHSPNGNPSYFALQGGNQQTPPSHPFINTLNQALNTQIVQGGNQNGTIRLPGPFDGLSIPTDPCVINGACGSDSLQLSNVKLKYSIINGNLHVELDSVRASVWPNSPQKWISCKASRDTISIYRPSGTTTSLPSDLLPYNFTQVNLGAVVPSSNSGGAWAIAPDAGAASVPPNYRQAGPTFLSAPNSAPAINFNPFSNFIHDGGNAGGSTSQTNLRITREDCEFPEPRIKDERTMGSSNRKFYLTFIGDPTQTLSHCGGSLPHRLKWHQRDRNNVDYWINVNYLGPGAPRTWNRIATGSGGEQDYDRTFYLPDNGNIFAEPGLYQYDIYMKRDPIPRIESGAQRWLTVYKCIKTCAPGNVVIASGGGEACLEQAANRTFTAAAATPTDFGPFTYAWHITGPEPDKNASSSNQSATFSFTTPGTYAVGLTVTDRFGKSTQKTSSLKVINCNVCQVGINGPTALCLNHTQNGLVNLATPVTFSRNYLNNCIENTCIWQVTNANGQVLQTQSGPCNLSTQSFTYSFTQPGNYFVKVRSTNNNPSITGHNEETHLIQLRDCRPPRADFSIDMGPCPDRAVFVQGIPLSTVPIDFYHWSFGDGTTGVGPYASHIYAGCGPQTITLTVGHGSETYSISHTFPGNSVRPCHGICDCKSSIPLANWGNFSLGKSFLTSVGKFQLDPLSGGIDFAWPNCPRKYPLDCWRICDLMGSQPGHKYMSQVVSASATTFSGTWGYEDARYPRIDGSNYQGNPFEAGKRGRWLPKEQYVYRAPITHRDPGPTASLLKNFSAGTFVLELFDWRNGFNDPDKWVKTSTTNAYTPNSEPEEDENILHVRSTAKYGYKNTLMTLAAQNAAKHTVAFESFENLYPSGGTQRWEEGVPFLAGSASHVSTPVFTGKMAVQLSPGRMFEAGMIVGQGESLVVRIWGNRLSHSALHPGDFQVLVANSNAQDMKPLTEAGEWTLYEAVIPAIAVGNVVTLQLRSNVNDLVVDDLRVQPYTSEMVCYVYDNAQRLLAAFDDQHFPLLYQYNAQGQLVRKLKVTREGVKTISETEYNTAGENRF